MCEPEFVHNMGAVQTDKGVKMITWVTQNGEKISDFEIVQLLNEYKEELDELKNKVYTPQYKPKNHRYSDAYNGEVWDNAIMEYLKYDEVVDKLNMLEESNIQLEYEVERLNQIIDYHCKPKKKDILELINTKIKEYDELMDLQLEYGLYDDIEDFSTKIKSLKEIYEEINKL